MESKNTDSGEKMYRKKEIKYEIPIEGSLGLLALGAVGLLAWRRKKQEIREDTIKKENNNPEGRSGNG